MNSSEYDRRDEKNKEKKRTKFLTKLFRSFIIVGIVIILFIISFSVDSCLRKSSIEGSHKVNVELLKLPYKETPLLLTDSLVFDEGSLDNIDLVIYYSYSNEINRHKIDNIPLKNCIFTGKYYINRYRNDTIKDKIVIFVQDPTLGSNVYNNDWKEREIIDYIKKHPNVKYEIYGDELTIAKFIGIKRKAQQ